MGLEATQRASQKAREAALRSELGRAALAAAGEFGYRGLTVEAILTGAGTSRALFYARFANKSECYAAGYQAHAEWLAGELLAAGAAAPDWLTGLRNALERLAAFAEGEPSLAKGVFAEVHVAGGAAAAKRKEVFERLSRALDSARRETSESRHSPPPITAAFILSAIEAAVVRTLTAIDPIPLEDAVGELTQIAGLLYFGEAATSSAGSA